MFETMYRDMDFDRSGSLTVDKMAFRMFKNLSKRDKKLLMQVSAICGAKFKVSSEHLPGDFGGNAHRGIR